MDARSSRSDRGGQLTPSLCSCGCGRPATKGSSYRYAWHCDPSVSDQEKRQALQLGGRRGAMKAAEVVRTLEGADLATVEGRHQLRDRFLRLRLAGRIGSGQYRDVLAALDGAAKDVDRAPKTKMSAQPIVVEVQSFDNGPEAKS